MLFRSEATVNAPLKVPVTLQLDPSVVAWYKQQFPQEYQTLINAILEKYMLEHNCEVAIKRSQLTVRRSLCWRILRKRR